MRKKLLWIVPILFAFAPVKAQESIEVLTKKVYETNVKALPYDVNGIVVRGFDGQNPPPRIEAPTRPLFYGYGITAYNRRVDSLIFFNVERVEFVHRDKNGAIIKRFTETGNRYTEPCKAYFLALPPEEKKNVYFEDIFLSDKKGNYLKLTTPQKFCPHCE